MEEAFFGDYEPSSGSYYEWVSPEAQQKAAGLINNYQFQEGELSESSGYSKPDARKLIYREVKEATTATATS